MNLIEQLGGYEHLNGFYKRAVAHGFTLTEIKEELLKYRRQHNIFEVEDKVVYVDDFMTDSVSVVSEVNDRVWLNNNKAVCIKEIIKHATDAEIKVGYRL